MDQATLGGPAPEPETRPPLALWDRVKFILLFVGVFAVLVWNTYIELEVVGGTIGDAIEENVRNNPVWLLLAWIEVLRQLHYSLSERWAGWHRFWSQSVFGRFNRRMERFDDWNRYRLARLVKWFALGFVAVYVVAQIYDLPIPQALFQLPRSVWDALPLIVQFVFFMALAISQFIAIFWFLSRGGVETYMPNDIRTRFSDVWGQDAVLDRVKENLVFLEDPESIEAKGGYVPGGILLWGPPGTGKTLLAEAAAGETGKPFVFVEPGAFIAMFVGVGVLKVKSLFRKIRKLALRYGGVVVFFDEADSLGNRGALATGGWNNFDDRFDQWTVATACNGLAYQPPSVASLLLGGTGAGAGAGAAPRAGLVARIIYGGMGGGGGMGTLQALLAEMQGMKKPRGFFNRYVRRLLGMRPKPPPKYRTLFIMATNMPQSLDEALLRPGRIDRIYKMGYPSKDGRRRTFEGYLEKVEHELTSEQIEKLAVITRYATGATIKDMVNEALVIAIRDGRNAVAWHDILRAKQLKEHGLPDDAQYIDRERHAVAVHEACHAVASYRLRSHEQIDIATIERRGDVGGFVSSIPPEDLFMEWKSERETDVMVFLASLAGERLFFGGDNSTGVTGDLRSATAIALMMEGFWGMGDTVASRLTSLAVFRGGQPVEDGTDRALFDTPFGQRVEARLAALLEDVRKLLAADRQHVLAIAHALEEHKTISGEDVEAIVEGREGSMVDGRLYHQDGAAAALEAYHEASLEAHDTHSRPSIELPVLAELAYAGNGKRNGNGSTRTRRRRTPEP